MTLRVNHCGDIHLEEDRYFGDTAQCLEWFVYDSVRQSTDLFVIDGDLTTYKATIKERNLWIDMVIRMADHAPVLIVSGNHGKESDGDLYALAKAKGKHSIYLSTEPELIEFDHVAVATVPYPYSQPTPRSATRRSFNARKMYVVRPRSNSDLHRSRSFQNAR